MFERFTQDARAAVAAAQDEARALGDAHIGSEHILVGLAGDGSDPASVALRQAGVLAADLRDRLRDRAVDALDPDALAVLGIDLDQVRRAAEERFGVGALDPIPRSRSPRGHIPFSPGAKKSLELALRAAVALRSDSITTGHLLVGVLEEGQGRAVRVLGDAGVDVGQLLTFTRSLLGSQAA